MNENDAIEQAYKNGYEAGVKELAKRLKLFSYIVSDESTTGIIVRYSVVTMTQVDDLVTELTERKEDEGK